MIYAVGCSFTHGAELVCPEKSAWPVLLADRLGSSVKNHAVSGGSNYRNVYQTIKYLNQNFELYIIAWTSYARYTYYKSDNNFEMNFSPGLTNSLYGREKFYRSFGQMLFKYWHSELYAFKIWLQQIIQLQSLLEKHKKHYVMVNTMENNLSQWLTASEDFGFINKHLLAFDVMNDEQIFAEHKEIQYYQSLIDQTKFCGWGNFHLGQLCEVFPCGPGGHFLEAGHAHVSELIYTHLCSE
jgi:hypothetical protein